MSLIFVPQDLHRGVWKCANCPWESELIPAGENSSPPVHDCSGPDCEPREDELSLSEK
jgi:hypothetical protein